MGPLRFGSFEEFQWVVEHRGGPRYLVGSWPWDDGGRWSLESKCPMREVVGGVGSELVNL